MLCKMKICVKAVQHDNKSLAEATRSLRLRSATVLFLLCHCRNQPAAQDVRHITPTCFFLHKPCAQGCAHTTLTQRVSVVCLVK